TLTDATSNDGRAVWPYIAFASSAAMAIRCMIGIRPKPRDRAGRTLIRRRLFRMIDNQILHGAFACFQFQAKLILNCREERGTRIGVRVVGCKLDPDAIVPLYTRLVLHRAMQNPIRHSLGENIHRSLLARKNQSRVPSLQS